MSAVRCSLSRYARPRPLGFRRLRSPASHCDARTTHERDSAVGGQMTGSVRISHSDAWVALCSRHTSLLSMSSSPASVSLGSPLRLRGGATLPNRMVKAAMTEGLADPATNLPNSLHERLYARWSAGGIGAQLTGNVMVDRRYLEAPGNVCIESGDAAPGRIESYTAWARAIQGDKGCKAIMQLSHAGRQCPISCCSSPIGPSAIPLALPGMPAALSPVATPRAMTLEEIAEVTQRFKDATRVALQAGFDGVQIHSAHGYLLSSFLSPKFNHRTDAYGGSAANRRRLLLEVIAAVRSVVPSGKILALKLNSADFQHGGFTEEESLDVIAEVAETVDFIEVSGGTYENSVMMKSKAAKARDEKEDLAAASSSSSSAVASGSQAAKVVPASTSAAPVRESTLKREAYFLSFCERVRAKVPGATLMLSGGWRSGLAMTSALTAGAVDLIGMARPLCVVPDFPRLLLASPQLSPVQFHLAEGKADAITLPSYSLALHTPFASLNKTGEAALENLFHQAQMIRMARGVEPDVAAENTWGAVIHNLTLKFVRVYIWEPRKKPRQTRAIVAALTAAAVAGVALVLVGRDPKAWQVLGERIVEQGNKVMAKLR